MVDVEGVGGPQPDAHQKHQQAQADDERVQVSRLILGLQVPRAAARWQGWVDSDDSAILSVVVDLYHIAGCAVSRVGDLDAPSTH